MRYFLLLVFFGLLFPIKAFAQESGGISVNPAYIDVEVQDPAEKKEFEVSYTNNSSKVVLLEIFSIDFRQTDELGSIGFLGKEAGSYEYGMSSFLSFEVDSLQLEPGETKSLKAIVSNRQDLSPGGHYAAVIARLVTEENLSFATDSASQGDALQLRNGSDEEETPGNTKISPAVSSLVFLVKKGGERYNLSLKDADWPRYPVVFGIPSTIVLTFQNEGNVHQSPFGKILIKDMLGREVYKGSLNNSSFKVLPSSRRIIPGYLNNLAPVIPFSFMTMEIEGTDFGKNTNFVLRESFIYINPIILLLPIIIFAVVILIKRRRKSRKKDLHGSKQILTDNRRKSANNPRKSK